MARYLLYNEAASHAVQVVAFLLDREAEKLAASSAKDLLASDRSQDTVGGPVTMIVMLQAIANWLRELDASLKT